MKIYLLVFLVIFAIYRLDAGDFTLNSSKEIIQKRYVDGLLVGTFDKTKMTVTKANKQLFSDLISISNWTSILWQITELYVSVKFDREQIEILKNILTDKYTLPYLKYFKSDDDDELNQVFEQRKKELREDFKSWQNLFVKPGKENIIDLSNSSLENLQGLDGAQVKMPKISDDGELTGFEDKLISEVEHLKLNLNCNELPISELDNLRPLKNIYIICFFSNKEIEYDEIDKNLNFHIFPLIEDISNLTAFEIGKTTHIGGPVPIGDGFDEKYERDILYYGIQRKINQRIKKSTTLCILLSENS